MSEQITLTIPTSLYRRASRIARLHQKDVADVLVEAIVLAEEEGEETAVDREEAAFRRLHPILRQKYQGQYVAIYGGELVDHDTDQLALFLRMRQQYPDQFVWIAPVRSTPQEIYRMRSPRFVENS